MDPQAVLNLANLWYLMQLLQELDLTDSHSDLTQSYQDKESNSQDLHQAAKYFWDQLGCQTHQGHLPCHLVSRYQPKERLAPRHSQKSAAMSIKWSVRKPSLRERSMSVRL